MTRRLAPGVLLALSIALGASGALAQSRTPERNAGARQLFERGVEELTEGRFADALADLEESNRARPAPIVVYNLGLAYRGLGRYREAIRCFAEYLEGPERNADPRRVESVRHELPALRARLVEMRIDVQPNDALVSVDGRNEALDHGVLTLDPGPRVIEITAEGYRAHRVQLDLQSGPRRVLSVQLESLSWAGRLEVLPSLTDADVFFDGQFAGNGRAERYLPAGDHRVEVRAPHYVVFRRTVHVGETGLTRVDATLVRATTPFNWVVPGLIAGGAAVVIVSVIVAVAVVASAPQPAYTGAWGNVQALEVRP